jgi:hypothetical protein
MGNISGVARWQLGSQDFNLVLTEKKNKTKKERGRDEYLRLK